MLNEFLVYIVQNIIGQKRASWWYYKYRDGAIIKSLFKENLTPAKKRWLESKPRKEFLWGLETSGGDFINKVIKYYKFDEQSEILEVGPGLGRLLKSILKRKVQFKTYLGIDITKSNVEYLKETIVDSRLQFLEADPESIILDKQFDLIISSLMFKHFMPTFEKALANLSKNLKKGGMIFFDLDEETPDIDDDTLTCQYTTKTVKKILERCGITLVSFDKVTHVGTHKGLLVVGKK